MTSGSVKHPNERQVQAGLKNIIRDGVAGQTMGILTGGAFLVAFAVKLGASNVVIGLLAAIGPLSQLLQLPSIVLIEKVRKRRAITVTAAAVSRAGWGLIAISAFVLPGSMALTALLVLLMIISAFGAVAGCSWNS